MEDQTYRLPRPSAPGAFQMPLTRWAWLILWGIPCIMALSTGLPLTVTIVLLVVAVGGALPTPRGYVYQVVLQPFNDLVARFRTARAPNKLFHDESDASQMLGLRVRRVVVADVGMISFLESGSRSNRTGTYWLKLSSNVNPMLLNPQARQAWAERWLEALNDIGMAGVTSLSFIRVSLPHDPTPNLDYIGQRLDPNRLQDTGQPLVASLLEALDHVAHRGVDGHSLLAISLSNRQAWGNPKAPLSLSNDQYNSSGIARALAIIIERLRTIGCQASPLTAVEHTKLLGSALDPTNCANLYSLAHEDRSSVDATPLLLAYGPWPQIVTPSSGSLQVGDSWHGFFEVCAFEGQQIVSANWLDSSLAVPTVLGGHCVIIRLRPPKASNQTAKWRYYYRHNRNNGRLYDPQAVQQEADARDNLERRTTSSSVFAVEASVLVWAAAPTSEALAQLGEWLPRAYSAKRVAIRPIGGHSRQGLAMAACLGVPVK